MPRPDFAFRITGKTGVRVGDKNRAVISCQTKGKKGKKKVIHLEVNFRTLEKLHEQIRKTVEAF